MTRFDSSNAPTASAALVVLALLACTVSKTGSSTDAGSDASPVSSTVTPPSGYEKVKLTPAEIETLRSELIASQTPFLERKEYVVTEPTVLDPVLFRAIYHGSSDSEKRPPSAPAERKAVLESASSYLAKALREGDGLKHLETLLEKRYAAPVVVRSGDDVTIDAGVVPGVLSAYSRTGYTYVSSKYRDDSGWKASEVARFFAIGQKQYADAKSYKVISTELNEKKSFPVWSYVFDVARDRITVSATSGQEPFVTPPLGGGDLGPYERDEKNFTK